MKKRLTLIILTVVLLLVGKADALTLTQKLGDEYMETEVEEGEVVTMNFTSKLGFQFQNWEVSGVTGVDTTNPEITFEIGTEDVVVEGKYVSWYTVTFDSNGGDGRMSSCSVIAGGSKALPKNKFTRQYHTFEGWSKTPDGEVVYQDEESIKPEEDMTLYAVWKLFEVISIGRIPVGSYVSYEPPTGTATAYASDTGTSGNQSFTPTSYKDGWKLYKHNNGQVEIISAESIGNLELEGGTGYANVVYTLNTLCSQYVNDRYAVSGRSLGSTADWIEEPFEYWTYPDGTKSAGKINTNSWDGYPLTTAATNDYPYYDTHWVSDVNYIIDDTGFLNGNVMEYPLLQKKDFVWLAGRNVWPSSTSAGFAIRFLSSYALGGDLFSESLEVYTYNKNYDDYIACVPYGVRPVIVLKPGIKVVSGDGSKERPYLLYPEHTVTFNSNGGSGSMENLEILDGLSKELPKNVFTRKYHVFEGWSETPNGEVAYEDQESIKVERDMTLYAVWKQTEPIPIEEISVGSYIYYEPPEGTVTVYASDTGTSGDQFFTPTDYRNGWKLFKKDNGQVEIITAESVGYLWLEGATGYANVVYTLNTLCRGYVNNEYAVGARSLGSTYDWIEEPVNPTNADSTKSAGKLDASDTGYPVTIAKAYENNFGYPYTDYLDRDLSYIYSNAVYDENGSIVGGLFAPQDPLWIAVREAYGSSTDATFNSRVFVPYMGSDYPLQLYYLYSGGEPTGDNQGQGVCPIIRLKSGLKAVSGNGTAEKPYVLTK